MRVTILGCGTSGGVPRPGGKDGLGEWGAANPNDDRNRRRRCSILVQDKGKTLLVDTSPDLRAQLLDAREHPERHPDLIVRLYGYSARFVTLTPEMQDEFLSRNLYRDGLS